MLRIFPYIFLVIMTLFTVVPTVDQVWGKQICKIVTVGSGMAEEEIKVSKENEIHYFSYDLVNPGDTDLKKGKKSTFFDHDTPISQLFVLLPDLPPEV
jgi:hypothetical protein